MREFQDQNGARWTVWDTIPASTVGLTEQYRRGWLTFDNGSERCRLAPIPDGWPDLPNDRLVLLLRVAHTASPDDTNVTSLENERRVAERRQQQERRVQDRRNTPIAPKPGLK